MVKMMTNESEPRQTSCSGNSSACRCRIIPIMLFAILVMAGVYYALYCCTTPTVNNESVAQLQSGMSPNKIQMIVGAPNGRQVIDGQQIWWFYDRDQAQLATEPRDIANLTITFDHQNKLLDLKYMQR